MNSHTESPTILEVLANAAIDKQMRRRYQVTTYGPCWSRCQLYDCYEMAQMAYESAAKMQTENEVVIFADQDADPESGISHDVKASRIARLYAASLF